MGCFPYPSSFRFHAIKFVILLIELLLHLHLIYPRSDTELRETEAISQVREAVQMVEAAVMEKDQVRK